MLINNKLKLVLKIILNKIRIAETVAKKTRSLMSKCFYMSMAKSTIIACPFCGVIGVGFYLRRYGNYNT